MALRDWLRVRPEGRYIRRALVIFTLAPTLLLGGEALVRARLHPLSSADSATRVYARPLVLSRGDRPDRGAVQDHLQRLGYRRAQGGEVGIGEYYFGSRGWLIGLRPFRGSGDLVKPGFAILRVDYSGQISRVEDEEGRRLDQLSLEPELIGRIGHGPLEDRVPVLLDEVPEHLVSGVLTVEDQRFFEHAGLDFRRIAAAFMVNFRAGTVVQGGSTLTQQLAKNLYLSPKRSVVRKVREAMIAVALERRHTKEEILQAYLNHVYVGQDGAVAIHGVGRAAEHFFGKDVATLGLAESALLVALIRAPSLYSPFRNPGTAVTRRNLVLRLMRDEGFISEEEYQKASDAPLTLRKKSPPIRSARYFLDYVAEELRAQGDGDADEGADANAGEGVTAGGGVRAVVTTLDANLQRAAEKAVSEGLARLERDFDWLREEEAGEPLQAALVALDPRTGEILAMVGGRDYGTSQFNRAVRARRQPGSAFKPVVALAALARPDHGSNSSERNQPRFTLASVLEDEPFQIETPVGMWQPANYDRSFSGPVTLRDALERSLNVPFARLGLEVGPERIVETARKMGIESPLNPYPSLALGASEVSPLELTQAFGVLAAGGFRPELKSRYGGQPVGRQAFDPAETFLVTSALRGAVERGTGRGIRELGFHGDVAAKSGTTNDFRDGWFIGYTPSIVVGVWVGFDHGRRLELPGAGVALPIFAAFLRDALGSDGRSGPWGGNGFSYPSGLEIVDVDPSTGLRGGWGCRGEPEIFLRGTAPEGSCGEFRVDSRTLRLLLERGGDEVSRLIRRIFEGKKRNREPVRNP
ncbi:MAG: transglycosylase domain-containing protein [Gemmatimonadota bacterium]